MPDAIPYVTSYYKRRWGFCLTHNERKKLKKGKYKVYINAKHDENGVLNYADFILPSTQNSKDEILISQPIFVILPWQITSLVALWWLFS